MFRSSISVVMPAFNEGESLASVLQRLHATLEDVRLRHDVELIVVDDGSTDATAEVLSAFAVEWPGALRICTHAANKGLVEAMKTGARAAGGTTLVMLDADLSYSPELIETLAGTLRDKSAAAVLASPYMPGGRVANVPFDRLVASRVANWLLSRCVGGRVKTFTGMVRAYDSRVFRTLIDRETRGEFNAWVVAELLSEGSTLVEIPAALVWPESRTAAAPRLTFGKLWQRMLLVLQTAQVLTAANRSLAAQRPARVI